MTTKTCHNITLHSFSSLRQLPVCDCPNNSFSGGYEPFPIFIDNLDKDFAFSLYELDWDVFGVHIEGAMHRLPILQEIGVFCTSSALRIILQSHYVLLYDGLQKFNL